MAKQKHRRPAPDEQHVLDHCQVRLLTGPDDIARCDELIVEEHYLKDATIVGEHLRYAILYRGKWLGVAPGAPPLFISKPETNTSAGALSSAAVVVP